MRRTAQAGGGHGCAGGPANEGRRAAGRPSVAPTLRALHAVPARPPLPRSRYDPRVAPSAARAGALWTAGALLGWAPGSLSSTALAIVTIGTERS